MSSLRLRSSERRDTKNFSAPRGQLDRYCLGQTFNRRDSVFRPEDMKGLSDFIEKEFLKPGKGKEVSLNVGGSRFFEPVRHGFYDQDD